MSKGSNVEKFNNWLDSEGICDLMSHEALEFKKLLKSKVEALIASECTMARIDELSIVINDDRNPPLGRDFVKERLAALTQEKDKR